MRQSPASYDARASYDASYDTMVSEAEPGRKADNTVDETGSTTLVDAGEHDLKARQRMLLVVADCSNAEPGRKADDTVIKEGPQNSF